MLQPHVYQTNAVLSLWEFFRNKTQPEENPIVAIPTGGGKSIIIAEFCKSVLYCYPNTKILCVTHVKELIQQNYEELLGQWPEASTGIYSAGLGRRDTAQSVVFCGVASIARNISKFGSVDFVLIDECHLVSDKDVSMYRKAIAAIKQINPLCRVIGFTATPWRRGSGALTESDNRLFTDIAFDMVSMEPFNWMVEQGYLMPLITKKTQVQWDASQISMRGGDYKQDEVEALFLQDDMKTFEALKEVVLFGEDRGSWLGFCSGLRHGEMISQMLTYLGVSNRFVHSELTSEQRDEYIKEFKSGKIRCLVNYGILTTGFNHKPLDLIFVLRATTSVVLWGQILGRGTRCVYAPGHDLGTFEGRMQAIQEGGKKNCLVLDYAANTKKLGPINDPVLPHKSKKKGPGDAPYKECPACGSYNHARAAYCGGKDPQIESVPEGYCGHKFEIILKIDNTASDIEVVKLDLPKLTTFKVDTVLYKLHQKLDAPIKIVVEYYCGLRKFTDYVCLEHTSYAGIAARNWWINRAPGQPVPATCMAAMKIINDLPVPTHIEVQVSTKPNRVTRECFDGSNFGESPYNDERPSVKIDETPVMDLNSLQGSGHVRFN